MHLHLQSDALHADGVLHALLNAEPDAGLAMDDLAALPGYRRVTEGADPGDGRAATRAVARDLFQMAEAGLIEEGLRLTAFVKQGVTGASRGIGKAIAIALAEAGTNKFYLYRTTMKDV